MKFKIGDVVQLLSGGPKMTVYLIGEDYVTTVWFDINNQLNHSSFEPNSLFYSSGAL